MKVTTQAQENYTILSQQGFADVLVNNVTNEKSLHGTKTFKTGDVVSSVDDRISTKTATYSATLAQPLIWDFSSVQGYTMAATNAGSSDIAAGNGVKRGNFRQV